MQNQALLQESAVSPHHVIDAYRRAHYTVHGREVHVRYAGNSWYFVNNEAVHHKMLLQEITRLREVEQRQTLLNADKSIIHRLIARLRGL
jgi:hypothetical protein